MMRAARTREEKIILVSYLASKIGTTPQALVGQMPFEVASITRNGAAVGAVLYSNYRTHSIELTAAGEPGWLSRGSIQAAFDYPFNQLGVWTVLTMVNRRNAEARELQRRLGFTELCVIETGEKSVDIVLYGMTRDKCLWINSKESSTLPQSNGHMEALCA